MCRTEARYATAESVILAVAFSADSMILRHHVPCSRPASERSRYEQEKRMDLPDVRRRLVTLILDGLVLGEKRARSELSPETLYAVTLYSASGFQGLGVAVN